MKTALSQIIEVMSQKHGMDISMYNGSFLERSFEKRLSATGSNSSGAYLLHLSDDRNEAGTLLHSLSVSYSEFFRNPLTFALLEQMILPRLVEEMEKAGGTEIRIWSAACAAGQEAYSVAILLEELALTRGKAIPYRIFATDICERELVEAREGIYDVAAVKNVRLRHLSDCFSRRGETYAVAPRLRERVDFSLYDLLDGESTCPPACIFGDFDLIFCSNVLFYYRPELQQAILKKMQQCLTPHGYFVTGEAERGIVKDSCAFHELAPPITIFRNSSQRR